MAFVKYTSRQHGGMVYEIKKDVLVIGRSKDCDIPLPDDHMISRAHAEIRKLPSGEYVLKDLASKNGTFVNGAPIQAWVLKDGDVISAGSTALTFKSK